MSLQLSSFNVKTDLNFNKTVKIKPKTIFLNSFHCQLSDLLACTCNNVIKTKW